MKVTQNLPSFFRLSTRSLHMFSTTSILGGDVPFYLFVELLNTSQDILKSSTNMQDYMNEAANLVALVTKLKEDHAKELEARDLKHASELSKMTEPNKNMSANLGTGMENSQE